MQKVASLFQFYFDGKMKTKWRVSPVFIIKLHIKDIAILEEIKYTLGVGKIRKYGTNSVQFVVESIKDLQIIVDHFDKYQLITAKVSDYLLFKQCFEIIKQGGHLTEEGILQLVGIKSSLNWGLSGKLKEAFQNVVPVNRPEYKYQGITDPNWVAGFTSGDGSFHILIRMPENTKGKVSVSLRYSINLNIRDTEVIKGLITYFKLYDTNVIKTTDSVETDNKYNNIYVLETTVGLQITKISDIVNTIIPFFEKYPIIGVKNLDFTDFKKAAIIIKNKEHLTPDGLNKILEIKSKMNRNRSW